MFANIWRLQMLRHVCQECQTSFTVRWLYSSHVNIRENCHGMAFQNAINIHKVGTIITSNFLQQILSKNNMKHQICFSKCYGKVGIIFWFLFHLLIWKNYVLTWDFDLKKVELWIFSLISLVKKHHKTTFLVKISV